MQKEIYQRKADTRDDLLARILDTAACMKRLEDQLRRTKRHRRTGFAKCAEFVGGIFEYLM